jgi:hypothetical protein
VSCRAGYQPAAALWAALFDVNETLHAELDKNHSEILHRFGDLDGRLSRIENGLGMNRA